MLEMLQAGLWEELLQTRLTLPHNNQETHSFVCKSKCPPPNECLQARGCKTFARR